MRARRKRRRVRVGGPSLEALAGALIAFAPATLFMEGKFATLPHPTHWVGDAIGIAGGYGIGALVAAYKEERFPFATSREVFSPRPGMPSRRGRSSRREGTGGGRDRGE